VLLRWVRIVAAVKFWDKKRQGDLRLPGKSTSTKDRINCQSFGDMRPANAVALADRIPEKTGWLDGFYSKRPLCQSKQLLSFGFQRLRVRRAVDPAFGAPLRAVQDWPSEARPNWDPC